MARMWVLWSKYCVIFILFTLYLDGFAHEDIYLYDTNDFGNKDFDISLELLDNNDHVLGKRDTDSKQLAQNTTIEQTSVISSTIAPKSDINKTEITKKLAINVKTNLTTLSKQLNKNFGENGTGIRKNYTLSSTTITPIVLTTKPLKQGDHLIVPEIKTNDTSDESSSNSGETEINIDKFSEDEDSSTFNQTLQQHHINQTKTDAQTYYYSTFTVDLETANKYWVKLENNSNVKVNGLLSNAYRLAATVKLSFDFPFYGHLVRNVTIATGGFLYMGEHIHSWLAATQYIAPLMANFNTGISNSSFIKYLDNGTSFTVLWEKVHLQDKPGDGEFTFQTTLFNTGDIVFVYKNVPVVVESIVDDHHPVKVGLSDAYIIDQIVFYVRRKTIYEYHRVNFNKDDIKNNTVIYLKALPTCLDSKNCHSCLTTVVENFKCAWCPSTNRCSNGFDRHRQDWLANGCNRRQVTNETQCLQVNVLDDTTSNEGHKNYYNTDKHSDDKISTIATNGTNQNQSSSVNTISNPTKESDLLSNTVQASRISQNSRVYDSDNDVKMGASGIITILFLVGIILGMGVWVLYAYRNPHTTSGQILIRYRPSQWRWKRGEARYTAATIHM